MEGDRWVWERCWWCVHKCACSFECNFLVPREGRHGTQTSSFVYMPRITVMRLTDYLWGKLQKQKDSGIINSYFSFSYRDSKSFPHQTVIRTHETLPHSHRHLNSTSDAPSLWKWEFFNYLPWVFWHQQKLTTFSILHLLLRGISAVLWFILSDVLTCMHGPCLLNHVHQPFGQGPERVCEDISLWNSRLGRVGYSLVSKAFSPNKTSAFATRPFTHGLSLPCLPLCPLLRPTISMMDPSNPLLMQTSSPQQPLSQLNFCACFWITPTHPSKQNMSPHGILLLPQTEIHPGFLLSRPMVHWKLVS